MLFFSGYVELERLTQSVRRRSCRTASTKVIQLVGFEPGFVGEGRCQRRGAGGEVPAGTAHRRGGVARHALGYYKIVAYRAKLKVSFKFEGD